MSAKTETTTTWTCERCGRVDTISGVGQPKGWLRAYFAHPPNHTEHHAIGDLCDPCGGYLVSFVHGTEAEERAAKPIHADDRWGD